MNCFPSLSGRFFILSLSLLLCSCSKNSELARVTAEARRGNAEAQYQLGAYYHDESGGPPDYQTAAIWFRKAAQQGHAFAQFALGEMCLNGEGMIPDELEAAKWITKAAEQGFAPAQDELAAMCSQGMGVAPDPGEALNWATKAAEQGYPEAQYRLGCLLSTNDLEGRPADLVGACVWLTLAAGEGFIEGEETLKPLQSQLNPAQLEEVRRRAELWKQKHGAGKQP